MSLQNYLISIINGATLWIRFLMGLSEIQEMIWKYAGGFAAIVVLLLFLYNII